MQSCRVVVNYELPWKPQKIERRIGRIHRIGQKDDVIVVNLAFPGSMDDEIIFRIRTSCSIPSSARVS